jgi:hypothetical protein
MKISLKELNGTLRMILDVYNEILSFFASIFPGFQSGTMGPSFPGTVGMTQTQWDSPDGVACSVAIQLLQRMKDRIPDDRSLPAGDASEGMGLSVGAIRAWVPCSSNALSIALFAISLRTDRARSASPVDVVSSGDEVKRSRPGHSVPILSTRTVTRDSHFH